MAKGNQPRYTVQGETTADSGTTMQPTFTTAAADFTGATATHNKIVFTADPVNGSRIVGLHFEAIGTNTQSVARIYINNGSAATTASNNHIRGQLQLQGTSTSNTTPVARRSISSLVAMRTYSPATAYSLV